jgi:sulfur carrier protein
LEIIANGKSYFLDEEIILSDFIKDNGFNPAVIVIEHNQKIVANDDWDNVILKNGDVLEIVSFVGGG